MKKSIRIGELDCLCCMQGGTRNIAYVLYPMDVLGDWIESASARYGTSIVVITGMDWDNVFSPWSAPGQPPGSPAFKGESKAFLDRLRDEVIPQLDTALGVTDTPVRTLVGVSMSGLFALWQWMICDSFTNIASLSGSFWYPGFLEWMEGNPVPHKTGKGYFLLGNQESKSPVKAFQAVGANTQAILALLKAHGVAVEFESVPGNHFAEPVGRLNSAFSGLFGA